jgi:hypothetical protein
MVARNLDDTGCDERKSCKKSPICPLPCLAPGSRLQQTQNQREGTNANMRGFGSTVYVVEVRNH